MAILPPQPARPWDHHGEPPHVACALGLIKEMPLALTGPLELAFSPCVQQCHYPDTEEGKETTVNDRHIHGQSPLLQLLALLCR